MSLTQQILTIAICTLATMLTRFLPFLIFNEKRSTPKYILYIGKALPAAIFSMLIVYCLKGVTLFSGTYGIPEAIAILCVVILHLWKRQILISIAGGTVIYMVLIQMIF